MAKSLEVDPVAVHGSDEYLTNAAQEAAAAFARHESELAEAADGWIGESAQALREFTAAVASRHAADRAAIVELSDKMSAAAARYTTADTDMAQSVASVAAAMGL